ncbi:MAG TPA: hypothetical protein VM661_14415 [Candidatus Sulfotelmatobacter sp.]|jgi:hypothetical protein|nr:hypothetical protein [Candidatus Sulfotelmatobacter sp.]
MMSALEARLALLGVKGILRFDATAFRCFPGSLGTCLRSFQVALWVAPLQALVVWLSVTDEVGDADPTGYLTGQALAYAVSWLLYPLLLIPISRHFHRLERLPGYLTAFNWFQLVEFVVMTPILAVGSLQWLPVEASVLLWMCGTLVLLAYEWFMLRRGLEVEGLTAASLVLINFLLNLLIYRAAEVLS